MKRTPDHGLFYQLCSLRLEAYLDADYAVSCEPNDRCSLGGFCIYLGHSPIYWSPKKNRIVSHSITKAESCQLAYTLAEILWLQSLFKGLGISQSIPFIYDDKISSISLASNPVFHA